MICGTCLSSTPGRIREGMRVTLSRWEQVWMSKEMKGTVMRLGHPEGLRRYTAEVKWDNGHKESWWPTNCLIPLGEPTP